MMMSITVLTFVQGMSSVTNWFERHVHEPLAKNGINMTLTLVSVHNTLKKPGPVFLEMARGAYRAGADYFYRINDDTELLNNWPTKFVRALRSLPPPYGVVGPFCDQGNTMILTHDFTHRTHMEVFDMNYYPPQLTDWWMDDWISFVYGKSRTFKAVHVPVIHHTGAHGQRYQVDKEHEKLLGGLLVDGRKKIRAWMLKNGASSKDITTFDKDVYTAFKHHDIPAEL